MDCSLTLARVLFLYGSKLNHPMIIRTFKAVQEETKCARKVLELFWLSLTFLTSHRLSVKNGEFLSDCFEELSGNLRLRSKERHSRRKQSYALQGSEIVWLISKMPWLSKLRMTSDLHFRAAHSPWPSVK